MHDVQTGCLCSAGLIGANVHVPHSQWQINNANNQLEVTWTTEYSSAASNPGIRKATIKQPSQQPGNSTAVHSSKRNPYNQLVGYNNSSGG